MSPKLKKVIFALFAVSGFCSLLYQVVWLRMAYASFGIITPVLSVVISVFMLGLALGSFLGGKWIHYLVRRYSVSPILFYALTEFLIGLGAFVVPGLFALGERLMLSSGEMNSIRYLLFSDVIIAVAILPWCILMGFTYPFMMSFLQEYDQKNTSGFSYLYLANVIGAMCGTLLTALVLIELAGFHNSLMIAALLNFLIFMVSLIISLRYRYVKKRTENRESEKDPLPDERSFVKNQFFTYSLLFFTGFTSMAMEVIWIRTFTPVMLTTIYSFAAILTVYLFATWAGSYLYRRHLQRRSVLAAGPLSACLAIFSFLPIVLNDPRLIISIPVILISLFPFCAVLGYLTPKLIDEYASGQPREAGRAYAVNIAGCVAGPLAASYILLPLAGEKFSLILSGIPFFFFFMACYRTAILKKKRLMFTAAAAVMTGLVSVFVCISYEDVYVMHGSNNRKDFYVLKEGSMVRRDHTATVVSSGEGMGKMLLVNGIGITSLTPVTKMMAHLPLAFCPKKPQSALIICLGMGTTYRSALTWDVKGTAVELVPSVKKAFGYYFADADAVINNPRGRIIIDDGRRFLNRTKETFDVITIDPPPPLEAAGSSLLYSEEFYSVLKKHLKEKGILQQWFPCGELKIFQAVARSLANSFPYIRVYKSVEGWGFHFLASMSPINVPTAREMISRIPAAAKADMIEWYEADEVHNFDGFIRLMLESEVPLETLLSNDRQMAITDDRPYNEYFFLRRQLDHFRAQYMEVSCESTLNKRRE